MPRFTLTELDNDDNDDGESTPMMNRNEKNQFRSGFAVSSPPQQQQQQQQQQQAWHWGGTPTQFSPAMASVTSPSFSRSSSTMTRNNASSSSSSSSSSFSLRLACTSPDGKAWYAVKGKPGAYVIATQLQSSNSTTTSTFTTPLPELIQNLLRADAPLGLLSVESDGHYETNDNDNDNDDEIIMPGLSPRLCLYASKTILLVQIKRYYPTSATATNQVQSPRRDTFTDDEQDMTCTALLEDFLVDYDTQVVRVKAAPQRHTGHAYYAPPTSMAVLLSNTAGTEYKFLTLQGQGNDKNHKQPWRMPCTFTVEGPLADRQHCLVDFEFGKSQGPLALLSSLTVLFVSAAGDVACASPILWQDAIVPKVRLDETLQTLARYLSQLDRTTASPHRKQVLAAQRYLLDVFCRTAAQERNVYVQAVLQDSEASSWPVAYQANILHTSTDMEHVMSSSNSTATTTTSTRATSLATVPAGDECMGVIVGRPVGWLEWAILSPVALLPLFAFCPLQDRMTIGAATAQQAAWVERAQMQITAAADMIVMASEETLVHVVVPHAVYTVSSNALHVAAKQLRANVVDNQHGVVEVPDKRTTAWVTVASPRAVICGATVWLQHGEGLAVQLADGTSTTTNVTQQQYRHELLALFPPSSLSTTKRIAAAEPADLQTTPPYAETIQPLLQQISQGLDKMSKIVGTQTPYQEMTPELFAYVLDIKERCETQVSMPLLELSQCTKVRKKALASMIATQQDKLNALLQQKEDLELSRQTILGRMERAEQNMHLLRERSARIRETLVAQGPTMTHAQRDFCIAMERTTAKVDYWDRKAQTLMQKVDQETVALEKSTAPPDYSNLNAAEWNQVSTLGDLSEKLLQKTRADLHQVDRKVRVLVEKMDMETRKL